MIPIFEKIEVGQAQSISSTSYRIESFDIPYHFHPEFEIVLIRKGTGKLFVKDALETFAPGDLFMFGANVPHLFIESTGSGDDSIEIEVIHFDQGIIINRKNLPEFELISQLISDSQCGLKCNLRDQKTTMSLFERIIESNGIRKYLNLVLFLNILKSEKQCSLIDRTDQLIINKGMPDRLFRVTQYIFKNYNNYVSLDSAAKIAHMNKAAFCRYFKKHTRKSFGKYVNDLRIDYATKLLIDGSLSISEISFAAGFNSVPYFIKQFKKEKLMSPKRFREKTLIIKDN